MATLQKVQIFPAIGIARLGNSAEWYLGPELPFPAPPVPPPGGAYKDGECRIKRQAQRFRLWGFFSDGTNRELTLADGTITWTLHLVNAKPTAHAGEPSIDGASVPLGDAEMDGEGRLIVRGGFGTSANPTNPNSVLGYFWETPAGTTTSRTGRSPLRSSTAGRRSPPSTARG
jgi:L-Lysine epsilon oxidase N-terminal